jgi:hypothetical protein
MCGKYMSNINNLPENNYEYINFFLKKVRLLNAFRLPALPSAAKTKKATLRSPGMAVLLNVLQCSFAGNNRLPEPTYH